MGTLKDDDFCKGCVYRFEAGVFCVDCPHEDNEEDDLTDKAIDNQGDKDISHKTIKNIKVTFLRLDKGE